MTIDHLVKLCVDFYTREEVIAARQLLEQHLPDVRMAKRQGNSAARATVEDMLKIILNPSMKLPDFHATAAHRLPPVDVSHCDVSAILKEVQALRLKVRAAADLSDEVGRLTDKLKKIGTELDSDMLKKSFHLAYFLLVDRPKPSKKLLMAFFVTSWQPG